MIRYDILPTRCGDLLVAIDERGLVHVDFVAGLRPLPDMRDWLQDGEALAPFLAEFEAYFAGRLQRFTLPLAARGTAFQQAVWRALCDIPYGETRSYGDIARAIGKPSAVRAVGAANGRNPLSIIVPCHRVIGQNGSLTGYAGGLPIKQALLALEGSDA
ncbi:methylated-DNA--[protein]-cysteine S-methyltransferase [Aeromonas taiwanensis]|uniref:Methylated-DNA--protein-cysteine methyltransferase n=1 Tax=Aeromonas taiwanensis TaxID=633417 RepID=A0A5F0KC71_9GAMM|nr:methylated-DNA--[protein]-cysteine S-methyltransferase [Aeromonas taiwanensis]TFF77206.1 methylated-DNA--[protein]-cysteine S-methyltransferase [Aeromonas taiwanensis]TFF77898.1 methylated-DNA--[protein]-cysteine S-methyltransferase [Aeromonas taiwanensis]TFF81670.1 methylated-DNA--[protein]-cysteine S-methyltransferase [Aeromonas taiwanensis]